MSNTKPFTEAHAIASVDFGLIFESELTSDDRDDLIAALTEHLSDLTRKDHDDGVIVFQGQGDGEDDIAEEVHLHKDFAHVITFDYRGWSLTRDDLVGRLTPVLEMVRRGRIVPGFVGLTFRDVFVNDLPGSYSPYEVFAQSQYLPSFIFSVGDTWRHAARWDEVAEEGVVRNFLTIEARNRDLDEGEVAHFTEIEHAQRLSGNQRTNHSVQFGIETISTQLDLAHFRNKDLLSSLLTDDMIQRIGLKEGS